jgi:Tfp pilus assembly protein FimT
VLAAAAAVLSRIATTLPDSDEADATLSGAAAISGFAAAHGYSSADALSGSSGAVMAPAVLLADSIGRAVNSRVKYLRFKHHQREWDAKEAAALAELKQQQQQQQLGEKLSSSLKRYSKANSKEAAEYAEGRARLQAYAELKSLRAASRKAAKSALVSAAGSD